MALIVPAVGAPLIQLALTDAAYRSALWELLASAADSPVACVENPDFASPGVVVMEPEHLDRAPSPIPCPEGIVLVAVVRLSAMKRAWYAGVKSIVSVKDPIGAAVLAVMAARLEVLRLHGGFRPAT